MFFDKDKIPNIHKFFKIGMMFSFISIIICINLLVSKSILLDNFNSKIVDKMACIDSEKIVKVGIIDGPINENHPRLRQVKILKKIFTMKYSEKDMEHGTSIAGVITTDNKEEYKGIIPFENIELYNASVMSDGYSSQKDIVSAIKWLVEQKVDIINISLDFREYSEELKRLLEDISIPIFISNGNGGYSNKNTKVIKNDNIYYVGKISKKRKRINNRKNKNIIFLPGDEIPSITNEMDTPFKYFSGSSYSTAITTGIYCYNLICNESHLDIRKNETEILRKYRRLQIEKGYEANKN